MKLLNAQYDAQYKNHHTYFTYLLIVLDIENSGLDSICAVCIMFVLISDNCSYSACFA